MVIYHFQIHCIVLKLYLRGIVNFITMLVLFLLKKNKSVSIKGGMFGSGLIRILARIILRIGKSSPSYAPRRKRRRKWSIKLSILLPSTPILS